MHFIILINDTDILKFGDDIKVYGAVDKPEEWCHPVRPGEVQAVGPHESREVQKIQVQGLAPG